MLSYNYSSMQVCHHCLKPLANANHTSAQSMFCSSACKQEATSAYHSVETALELGPLIKYCKHYEERFPLLVARAACMHLSQSSHSAEPSLSNKVNKDAKAKCSQGDVWQVQLWALDNDMAFCMHALRHVACQLSLLPVLRAQYRLHLSILPAMLNTLQRVCIFWPASVCFDK